MSHLKQYFPLKKSSMFQKEQLFVKANDDISIDIYEGETFGLVGESGCGKSTFGRVLLQLYHQTDGKTMYHGRTLDEIAPSYVEEILKNLDSNRKKLKELESKRDATQAEYNKLSETEKYSKKTQLDLEIKEAHDLFLDIAQLIGGFIVVEDLEPVSEIFLKRFHKAGELCEVNSKIQDNVLDSSTLSAEIKEKKAKKANFASDESKLRELSAEKKLLQTQANEKQKDLNAIESEIDKMRASYSKREDFEKFEEYLDDGIDLAKLKYHEMRLLRKDLQLIFQDPYSSLNPRMTVGQIIGEGLLAHKFFKKDNDQMQQYIMKVMSDCGLAPYMFHRYPHQFSGGQRQRIGIARSLALKPKFVVCDEAVSALDVSIQSQIINLLQDLKEQEHLTYLFISHDLSVVKYISDRIGVMYLGTMVELARSEDMFRNPLHPYTEALLSAIPTTDSRTKKDAILLEGDIPSPIKPPKGCKFHTRCRYCSDICKEVKPEFKEVEPGHFVACHHMLDHKVI